MLAAMIGLTVVCIMLLTGLSLFVGYLFRQYITDITPIYSHPECFDENGNPLPDQIIAFRFEGSHLDEFED